MYCEPDHIVCFCSLYFMSCNVRNTDLLNPFSYQQCFDYRIIPPITPSAKARVYIEEYVSVLHCLFFVSKNVKSKSYSVSVKFMSLCSDRCQLTNTHPDRDLHLSLCIVVSSYIML